MYKYFEERINEHLKNKANKEKLEWVETQMVIIEEIGMWDDVDKENYIILKNLRKNLREKFKRELEGKF